MRKKDNDIPVWVLALILIAAGLALTPEQNRDIFILLTGVAAFIKLVILLVKDSSEKNEEDEEE